MNAEFECNWRKKIVSTGECVIFKRGKLYKVHIVATRKYVMLYFLFEIKNNAV